jgi:DNA-directed RNA polymerase subunit RPC12/RpoP
VNARRARDRRRAACTADPVEDVDAAWLADATEYACTSCGVTFYLGGLEVSPGFGPVDKTSLDRLIVGDPPRCHECRHGPHP